MTNKQQYMLVQLVLPIGKSTSVNNLLLNIPFYYLVHKKNIKQYFNMPS